MSEQKQNLWQGLRPEARQSLGLRNYSSSTLAERLGSRTGVEAAELLRLQDPKQELADAWIPGVEVFHRRIFPQRHRGFFGEFAREGEGVVGQIGLWPRQWATARMFANTGKGFHIHPPHIPAGRDPAEWFQQLFVQEPDNYSARPYDKEQWDVMFFIQGVADMLLVDERAGMPRKLMHVLIEGDDHRGPSNAGIVIPAGVAHALQSEGSSDLLMVYGTSTAFNPDFEGRIACDVELAPLPDCWSAYLGKE